MDLRRVLLLCLCLRTAQSGARETIQDPLKLMQMMEAPAMPRKPLSPAQAIRNLEMSLLKVNLQGSSRIFQTRRIHSQAFDLACSNFTGLSLDTAQASHTMNLPAELTRDACQAGPRKLRLICIYFFMSTFFKTSSNVSLLNNYVLGAQLGLEPVHNLSKPVDIQFSHNQSLQGYNVTCVYWKEKPHQRYWGEWSTEGCDTERPSPFRVRCLCNHLSYFAVLMQLSSALAPVEVLEPLTYITIVGCSVSIVSSLLTALLHFHTRKQNEALTRIHLNLHGAVLLLNASFLLSPLLARPRVPGALCTGLGAVLHCALLSCFSWMAIEGFNLYILLGRVYNSYFRRYVLKLCAVGWGLPAFLVLLVLSIDSSVYGRHTVPFSGSQDSGSASQNVTLCWVRSPEVHYVLVMGYGGIMCLFNLVMLGWALRVLCRLRAREQALGARAGRDVVSVLGLTVLLGTTWTLGFFSFGAFLVPQLFLFTIINSLYGFFLFLWFCSQRCHSEAKAETEMETVSTSRVTQ